MTTSAGTPPAPSTETPPSPPAAGTPPAAVTAVGTAPPADAAQQLAAVNGRLEAMCNAMAAELPENLRALVPTGLPPADRLEWVTKAKSAGLGGAAAPVPETDTGRPKVTPKDVDLSTLPPMARLAAGYAKKA